MKLVHLHHRLAILRLEAEAPVPAWALEAPFFSVTCTGTELSVVVPGAAAPAGAPREDGWRALQVEGPLDLSLTGVLASLAGPLAAAGVPIFALSTHDTDLILVREPDLEAAVRALREAGHDVAPRNNTAGSDL